MLVFKYTIIDVNNNNNQIGIWWGILKNFVKFSKIGFFAFFIFVVYYVKKNNQENCLLV